MFNLRNLHVSIVIKCDLICRLHTGFWSKVGSLCMINFLDKTSDQLVLVML